jgi:DNA repair protein RecO (recombination protein O)
LKVRHDEAYVLRTQALGEADVIVTLLARRHGKVRGVARSARKSRRRFGGTLEPLTHVRAAWTEKEGRELHRIDALDGVRSFAAMQADPLRQAACAVVAELADLFAHDEQPDDDTFRLLGAVLEAMEGRDSPLELLRYFEYWTLRLHGLLADTGHCAACGDPFPADRSAWVGADGSLHCRRCHAQAPEGARRIGPVERRFLALLRRTPPGELPEAAREARPGGAPATMLRRSIESFAERRLRTYRHLERIAGAQPPAAPEPTTEEPR